MKIKHKLDKLNSIPCDPHARVNLWFSNDTNAKDTTANEWFWGTCGVGGRSITHYEVLNHKGNPEPINTHESYTFNVYSFDDVDFKKIQDDLSYADPLRIVEFDNGKVYSVIHHSVASKLSGSKLPYRIIELVSPICKPDIPALIKTIRTIKKAEWADTSDEIKGLEVTVAKVNI